MVRYLLDHGARAEVVDDMGKRPIDLAEGNGGNRGEARSREVVALLQHADGTEK